MQESMYRLRVAIVAHMGSDLSTIIPFQYSNMKIISGQNREVPQAVQSHWNQHPARQPAYAEVQKSRGGDDVPRLAPLRSDRELVCRGHRGPRLMNFRAPHKRNACPTRGFPAAPGASGEPSARAAGGSSGATSMPHPSRPSWRTCCACSWLTCRLMWTASGRARRACASPDLGHGE
jgi:hypothetical protein